VLVFTAEMYGVQLAVVHGVAPARPIAVLAR
jgi:hypothetical protein